nr:SNF2-related protein [Pseudomonas sp.]
MLKPSSPHPAVPMRADLRQGLPSDWQAAFAPACLERARVYADHGRATLLEVDELSLRALCAGSADLPYRQSVRLQAQDGGWSLQGSCSCPVGRNCKHVAAALLTLQRQLDAHQPIPAVSAPEEILRDDLQPQALLSLNSHVRVHFDARKGRMTEQTQHRAALAFEYAGHLAHGRQSRDLLVPLADHRQLRIRRDLDAEAALRRELGHYGFSVALRVSEALPEKAGEAFELPSDAAWLSFVREGLPRLREQGWRILIRPEFLFHLAEIDAWYSRLEETPEQNWFDLEMGIEVEGRRVSLLPVLLHAIRHTPWLLSADTLHKRRDDEMLMVPLPGGGRHVALPFARLKPLLGALGELFFRDPPLEQDRLRLAKPDAARLAGMQASLALEWQGGERLRRFAERLRELPQQPIEAPEGLNAQLRPYQAQGLAWMQALRELEAGGVLADDMGLGKTLQTLAHVLAEKRAGRLTQPALIVMPTSLIPNWQDEAARFAPDLRVLALHGPRRRAHFAKLEQYDLLLTTYALLPRDTKVLAAQPFHLLILDEAQNVKNARSKAAQAVRELNAAQRLCLTGTPLENHLGELWALFDFLMPGWLGNEKSFNQTYRTPIEKHADSARLAQLNARVRPFLLRRTKEQVARELPPKTEVIQWVELSDAQRDRYETLRLAMDRKVREEIGRQGLARSQIIILEALLRLRQACCDLRLLEGEKTPYKPEHSAKLATLLEMLEALFSEGRRVLLFSQFTGMLGLIEAELQRRKIPYALLTGATRDRRTPVQQFQAGTLPIFLISLKAGGAGLNLTAADTVIHFDPWWNPAAEAQASDRAYRIGQDKPVFVYKLIARGSVEEKIQQLQQAKAGLARGVLEGGAQSEWRMTEEEVSRLLAPLDA